MILENVTKILDLYNSQDWSEYSTYHNLEVKNKHDKKLKRNTWVHIDRIPKFSFVRKLINSELDKGYVASEFITLLVYEKGDFFSKHIDNVGNEPPSSMIELTGGYLLNDNFEGGEFFLNDQKLETPVGSLFTFGRKEVHEVKQITKGKRYSLHFTVNRIKTKSSFL